MVNSVWIEEIYVRGSISKSFLVRVIIKMVRNTVEGAKFTFTTMVCSVLIADSNGAVSDPSIVTITVR